MRVKSVRNYDSREIRNEAGCRFVWLSEVAEVTTVFMQCEKLTVRDKCGWMKKEVIMIYFEVWLLILHCCILLHCVDLTLCFAFRPSMCHACFRSAPDRPFPMWTSSWHVQIFFHALRNTIYWNLEWRPRTERKIFPTCLLVCLLLDTNDDVIALSWQMSCWRLTCRRAKTSLI